VRRVLSENSIILGYLVSYCQHGIYNYKYNTAVGCGGLDNFLFFV